MTNNYNAEAAKKIILEDNINVTEPKPLKDFAQVAINLVLVLVFVYLFIYSLSGLILISLSREKQIALENFISLILKPSSVSISEDEENRLNRIKNNVLKADTKFPKTPNLDIKIINKKQLNALCYPNGNIYITAPLYKELKTDEELTFVIAHEMGHYRHKDHLFNLRRNIANAAVIIVLAVASPNNSEIQKIAENGLNLSDLQFSKNEEEKADIYAIKVMNNLYGNAKAGVKVMNTIKKENHDDVEFLSTHPNIDKRIKYIEKYSKQ